MRIIQESDIGVKIAPGCNFSQSPASNLLMNRPSFSLKIDSHDDRSDQEVKSNPPPRWGEVCPQCGKGELDWNGLLELECPECGYHDTRGASYT